MYQALYRKYRPKDFDSVVGQDAIIQTLKNSIIHHNFSHAYMFFGPRGTGKTTVSKIFARNINCLSPKEGIACGKCDACKVSFSRECVDIIEIDAASNNGVDEIRELKSNINLVPSELKYKVYIVDEVHMLSTGAFNALLKTLEEPPEHAVFILATTDPQKVPETIISRCQCFSFKRISDEVIRKRLEFVCSEEKISIDPIVLDKISILSDGGLRDALGALDKLLSYTDKKITIDDYNEVNGIISDDDVSIFVENIMNGNIKDVLLDISKFNNSGKNLIQIISQIIDFVRKMVVDYYLNSKDTSYPIELLENFINLLNEKIFDIKKSSNTKVYIEMMLLKFINDYVLDNKLKNEKLFLNNNDFFDKKEEIIDKSVDLKENDDVVDTKNTDIKEDIKINNEEDLIVEKEEKSINSISDIPKILNLDDVMKVRINNTMATAEKPLLKNESANFELLKDYTFDQQIGYLVSSLLDAKLRAVCEKYILISYSSDAIVDQNLVNIVSLEDVYHKITKSNKNLAIISDDTWENIKKEYIKKLKNNEKYEILDDIDFIFEELDKNDIISSSAISLFGDDIVEIE